MTFGQFFSEGRGFSDGPIFKVRIPPPNARNAQAFQEGTEGYEFGPYNKVTRSCITYCMDTLRAGGVNPGVAEETWPQTRWLWSQDG